MASRRVIVMSSLCSYSGGWSAVAVPWFRRCCRICIAPDRERSYDYQGIYGWNWYRFADLRLRLWRRDPWRLHPLGDSARALEQGIAGRHAARDGPGGDDDGTPA